MHVVLLHSVLLDVRRACALVDLPVAMRHAGRVMLI